jgi:hypothetical protein
MKKFKLLSLATALTLGLASLNSCTEDKCKDVTCDNGGACVDGTCECADGYEGTTCQTKMTDKFAGSYKYNEPSGTGCGGFTDWPVTITASSSVANKVIITGFGAFQCSGADIQVEGTVNGTDLTIASNQSFCSGNIVINSGSGSINGTSTSITINYSYTQGGASASCSGTYVKN